MALAPAHPTTLFDSLARLHFPRLPLIRRRSSSTAAAKNPHFHPKSLQSTNPNPHAGAAPPPNWLRSWTQLRFPSLPKSPRAVVDYRNNLSSDEDEVGASRSTTSNSTMSLIVEKLKKFGYIDGNDVANSPAGDPPLPEKCSVEDIFYAEDGLLPDARGGLTLDLNEPVRFPWEKPEGGDGASRELPRKRTRTSIAELTLPEWELRRLRHLAIRMKSKMKIKGAGVTQEVVDAIHEKWMTEEVVRLKCEGAPALNMKRTHEILERKTGGLVIWRSGSSLSLYRGVAYEVPQQEKKLYQSVRSIGNGSYDRSDYRTHSGSAVDDSVRDTEGGVASSAPIEKDTERVPEVKYEHEMDQLLEDLGPRYVDWPGGDPLPVDADLLPGIVPGYNPPFRILPYGVRSSLGLKETTALRRLARILPPHFALGRSRQHQGLAAAMAKLWERSSIAKIALKRGVQITSSERMAQDIKKLTGGTLLSRNKDYLVFYRGKDFLSPEVTEALLERETLAKALQDEEEKARLSSSTSVVSTVETVEEPGTTGTLGETLEAGARWANRLDNDHKNMMLRAAEVAKHADLVRKLERKLSLSQYKLMRAQKALAKVEESLKPAECTTDPESITDEERFMFRKLGLRMKAYLLLGRRGVFDGTVENMHLHWKYRELVKVLVNAKTFSQVKNIALSLEAESGGVLVSVDKVSKGFAIIVFRGKDYKRPTTLRPKNLLTKRKALARSIELQRREAITRHVSNLCLRVDQLRIELEQMENAKGQGDDHLYAKLDSAYRTEDEDTEDEGDEAYVKSFDHAANIGSDKDGEADVYIDNGYGHEDDKLASSDDEDDFDGDNSLDDEDDGDDDNSRDSIHRVMNYHNSQ